MLADIHITLVGVLVILAIVIAAIWILGAFRGGGWRRG